MRAMIRSALIPFALVAGQAGAAETSAVDFNADIMPILSDRCFQCHGPDANTRKAGLRLDLEDSAKAEVIVPGKPEESELIHRITTTDPDDHMPPPDAEKPSLTPDEIARFEAWIAAGAPWAKHWAYVTPEQPAPPQGTENPIDAFVRAKLDTKKLQAAPEAPRETLIRRVSLDLTGLPPTLEEIDAFLADTSPNAYEALVDRLLASPRYGEHMAAEWLDGARFADSNGYQNDFGRDMSHWRDWVIQAFNDNMPFDQFTIEQIAGDLLPEPTDSQRIATGFLRNNRANTEGGSIEAEWHVENIVDRVETVSTVFLGLTMGCARCHDHKYEPISQKEFFEFFAILNSTADKGFYEETRGNSGPQIAVPNEENKVKLAEFDARIAEAEAALSAAVAAAPDNSYAAWEARLRNDAPAFDTPAQLHLPLAGDLNRADANSSLPALYKNDTGPVWQPGLLGDALRLDGTPDAFLFLGQSATFDRDQPFTVSAWVRPEGPGAIFSKMDDADAYRGVDTLITENGEIAVHIIRRWEENALKITTDKRIEFGQWAQVSVTYDGSSKADGIRVYVNGYETNKRIDADKLTLGVGTRAPLRIGRRATGLEFKGNLTDFRVFDSALDATAVSALVASTLAQGLDAETTAERAAALQAFHAQQEKHAHLAQQSAIDAIRAERAAYVAADVPTVMILEELPEPRKTYRLVRGAYDAPDTSEELAPGLPAFLPTWPEGAPHNRLGLAQWLVAPENPLTARVTMNRLWQRFFGRGLVKTPENFGVQSDPPTHPQLLDWLATEFIAGGWDLKAIQKRIVMSATYRQDSTITQNALDRDPENLLLARGPRFRLHAEALRDNALAVSGLLVNKIGGPSVRPYQPDNLWEELAGGASQGPYEQSTGDDLYRRSLYMNRKRTVPPPMLTTFDAPSRETCWVRRTRTNTPLQALALLNDVTYVEAARALATRMLHEAGPDASARVRHGFRLATGRTPSAREAELLLNGFVNYLNTYRNETASAATLIGLGETPTPENTDQVVLAAYTAVASVILNLDETMTKE